MIGELFTLGKICFGFVVLAVVESFGGVAPDWVVTVLSDFINS